MEILKKRALIIQAVRNFFIEKNYLEVETPVLTPFIIPESPIEVFKTSLVSPYQTGHRSGRVDFFLTPSPEIWMKKLLSEGSGSIFQITKAFRNSEQSGPQHNNEFTMLEWYTVDSDYKDSIKVTEELFKLLSRKFNADILAPPFEIISMNSAFIKYAGIDLEKCATDRELTAAAESAGFSINIDYNWEETFNYIFLTAVEPALGGLHPVILYDYPLQIPCLAKQKPGSPWLQRWELYAGGMETANCYTEETDKKIIDRFFRLQSELKKKAMVPAAVDFSYTDIFNTGFPDCSGTALGLDRLVMAAAGVKSIKDVIAANFS